MDLKKIGLFLAELRKERKLTQEQLGEKIGVTNKTISRWEKGNYLPSADMLKSLSEFYGVSINELLSGERLNGEKYIEKAEENITTIIRGRGLSRQEKWIAAAQWMRKNWWAILLCLLPAGGLYAAMPLAVSDKVSIAALATSYLLTAVMIVANHLIFYVSTMAHGATKTDPYAAAGTIRIVWMVILGVVMFVCIDLLLALLYSFTPAGTADGYAVYSMFYDILIEDAGSYSDNCFNALERGLWQLFLVSIINLDLAILWVKRKK